MTRKFAEEGNRAMIKQKKLNGKGLKRSVWMACIALLALAFFNLSPASSNNPAPAPNAHSNTTKDAADDGHGIASSTASCANAGWVEGAKDHMTKVVHNKVATFVTPPNPDGPVTVDFGLYIIQVTDIDETSNTFRFEGFMDLIWCDPRNAFDPAERGVDKELFLEEGAKRELDEIWWPDITFVNGVGGRTIENEELIIYPDGTVEYQERFSVIMAAHYDLKKFPFDKQSLEVEIESFSWPAKNLVFHREESKIGFSKEFEIAEWHTNSVTNHIREVKEIRDRDAFSEFILEINVERRWGYYVVKIMLPLALIVFVSWAVFWVQTAREERLGTSFTAILTVVAYQFVVADKLPKIAEVTFMEGFMTISFALMLLTIVENTIVENLHFKGKPDQAMAVDNWAKLVFPATYLLGIMILGFFYFV
jgi:hypothetical protein